MEMIGAMLRVDGRATSVPVRMKIDSPWLGDWAFTGFSYGKVEFVSRMYFMTSYV